MFRLIGILMLSFLSFPTAICQNTEDYPSLTKSDLPGAKFNRTREFNGESLYGYIDGGADLYLEYGFTGVRVIELVIKREKFKIEIWKMNSPESAFGIFSVSRFRCSERPDFSAFTCLNKYQFQLYSGSFYISIINEAGTTQSHDESIKIGRILSGRITGPSFDPKGYFDGVNETLSRNDSKLIKGKLGVVNGFPELEEFFMGSEHCFSLILRSGEKILISMNFENAGYMNEFAGIRKWDLSDIAASAKKMAGGELVRRTGEYSFFIEISDKM